MTIYDSILTLIINRASNVREFAAENDEKWKIVHLMVKVPLAGIAYHMFMGYICHIAMLSNLYPGYIYPHYIIYSNIILKQYSYSILPCRIGLMVEYHQQPSDAVIMVVHIKL